MTEIPVMTPPTLYLPPHPLAQAEACVAHARRALAQAGDLEWASAAADRYRGELEGLDASLAALADAMDDARERLASARWAAYGAGQL